MAIFKNISGTDLDVSVDGAAQSNLVLNGDTFEVPDEHADRLRLQPAFEEQKSKPKKKEAE